MRAVSELVIAVDDPRAPDVTALLQRHLDFAHVTTPPELVFALDVEGLVGPAVTFCSARRDGRLLAMGALQELDATHGELKSMHTASPARGQGIGAAMVGHLVGLARRRGYARVSLETGSQAALRRPAPSTRGPASWSAGRSAATRTAEQRVHDAPACVGLRGSAPGTASCAPRAGR